MIIDEESYKVSGEILEHVGIKGMKWGVRKSKAARIDARRLKKGMKKHNPKQFTNDELQTIITRMKLEQEYVRLTTPVKTKKTDGFVKTLIKNNAKHAVNIGIKEAMKAYERKHPAAGVATKTATKAVNAVVNNHSKFQTIDEPRSLTKKQINKINKNMSNFGR